MSDNIDPVHADSNWYVLLVRSNQEKTVEIHLRHRAIEYFLPCYASVSQRKDRRVKLIVPLFPGYVFVRICLAERLKVLTVPNVFSLVGSKNAPSVVSDGEIECIRRGVADGTAKPHPYTRVGDAVVITAGAMAGWEGTLLRTQNSTRVLICVTSISRAFTVEVHSSWIQRVAAKLPLRHVS